MRSPTLVPGPIFSPGHCMICGGNEGEMIDTRVDIPGDGRMYICTRLCIPLILAQISPVEIRKHCAATNLDGSPCKGWALPHRDLCVAHSKKKEAVNVNGSEDDHGAAGDGDTAGQLAGADLR